VLLLNSQQQYQSLFLRIQAKEYQDLTASYTNVRVASTHPMHVHVGAMLKETHERVEHLRQRQQPQLKQKIQDDRKNKEQQTIQQGSTSGNDYMSQRDAAIGHRTIAMYVFAVWYATERITANLLPSFPVGQIKIAV